MSIDALQATYAAADWLIHIAEAGVRLGNTEPVILRWLMTVHANCVEDLATRGELP